MTNHLKAICVLVRDDGQISIALDQMRGIDQLAIHLTRQRGLGQTSANRCSNL